MQTKLHAFCPYYVPVRAILKVWTINQTPSDFTGDTLILSADGARSDDDPKLEAELGECLRDISGQSEYDVDPP